MRSQLFQITHMHAYIYTHKENTPMKTDNAWITRVNPTPRPPTAHPIPQNKYIYTSYIHDIHRSGLLL